MAGVSDLIQFVVLEQIFHFARQTQLQFVNIKLGDTSLEALLARLAYQRLHFTPLLDQVHTFSNYELINYYEQDSTGTQKEFKPPQRRRYRMPLHVEHGPYSNSDHCNHVYCCDCCLG